MSDQRHLISDSPATYADLQAAPASYTVELIGGRLHAQPRPRLRHARASSRLVNLIGPPFDLGDGGPGGWIILEGPELHVVRDVEVLVPDLAGWNAERLAAMSPDEHRVEVVSDWVCEIVSPSTERYDRNDKLPIYARWGVPWVWLIDPGLKRIEVYRHTAGRYMCEKEAVQLPNDIEPVRLPPFEAVALPVHRLWL